MTDTCCVVCGKPMPDQAYACTRCGVDKPRGHLDAIADMTPAARDIAHGLSRHGGGSGGSGVPESRLPLDLAATAKLDGAQGVLTTWARHIAETRQGATWVSTAYGDPVVEASLWLAGQLEWMRHRREVDEFLTDVAAAARVVRGLARGPSEQKYLGPCGAPTRPVTEADRLVEEYGDDPSVGLVVNYAPCEGDVYAYRGAHTGRCRTCGAEVATADRQAWLDGETRTHAFTARDIAEAYGVNVKTIRTWASRPRPDTGEPPLASWWRTAAGLVTPWIEPVLDPDLTGDAMKERLGEISDEIEARGGRLHYVGDVLDLAAADAVRRAEQQSKRARRAAEQTDTKETAA